jgi:tetratricopeptide (TPR) repeat protein
MSVGPGWDWTTLISLYPNVDVYTQQLRALEAHIKANPDDAAALFVLAYQYLTAGHADAAARQLAKVVRLQPQDRVAKALLDSLQGGGSSGAGTPPPPAAVAEEQPEADIPAEFLLGTWTASGPDRQKFTLKLSEGGAFEWSYSQGTTQQSVKGVFDVDGETLAMEPDTGGVMLAAITKPENGQFKFALIGAPEGDPGLAFRKAG